MFKQYDKMFDNNKCEFRKQAFENKICKTRLIVYFTS